MTAAFPPGCRAATRAVRAGIDSDPTHGAVVPPIVLSSNFSFAGFGQKRRYDYTRSGNPTRDQLGEVLRRRTAQGTHVAPGVTITIGNEHDDPRLDRFTLVTGEYRAGQCTGVIGVIGPTRMPYDKVIALVSHTSRLLTELLD